MSDTQPTLTTEEVRKFVNTRAQYGVKACFCTIFRERDGKTWEYFSHGEPDANFNWTRRHGVLSFARQAVHGEEISRITFSGQTGTLVLAKSGVGDVIVLGFDMMPGLPDSDDFVMRVVTILRDYSVATVLGFEVDPQPHSVAVGGSDD